MNKRNNSSSIAFKLAVVFIFFVVFQSVLLTSLMVNGGVLEQAKINQYRIFSEKVKSRSDNLENELKNVWTNLEDDIERISRYLEMAGASTLTGKADQILEQSAPFLIDTLSHTETTGAFLVLPELEKGNDGSLPALYLRNNNPSRNSKKNANLYMLIGPWNVAEKMKIPTTANWSFRLNVDEGNRDFIYKPYEAALDIGKSSYLGYWSPPFKVNPQDEAVITYSIPLFDSAGNVTAIFGVEIAVSYLYNSLPASDLQASDSYGYIIGIRKGKQDILAAVTQGALQQRILEKGMPLDLVSVEEENSIYKLLNHNSGKDIYACVTPMGIYNNNTPFEQEEWMLIGLMEKQVLLRFPERIGRILGYSFLFSLAVGFVIAILTSHWFTRHAKLIELSGLPVGAFEVRNRSGRVYMTSQVPRLLNLTKEQTRRFSRDKNQFLEFLKELLESGTEENGIIRIEDGDQTKWIKVTCKTSDFPFRYVAEDVTDEILQTKALRKERDKDGLTGVLNRLAFDKAMEQANCTLDQNQDIALLMCDLNDLKGVNDTFGHDMGDEYIRETADRLQKVFADSRIFRIGGDEFALILYDISRSDVWKSIQILEQKMAEYNAEACFHASVAVGFAFYNKETDKGLEEVLSRADADMYEKKREMKA